MFDRFIRLAEARRALRKGQFERALQLAGDRIVRDDRRAEEIRERALDGMMHRARRRRDQGGLSAAFSDVCHVLDARPESDGARTLKADLEAEIGQQDEAVRAVTALLDEGRELARDGRLDPALDRCRAAEGLGAPAGAADEIATLRRDVERQRAAAVDQISAAREAISGGRIASARDCLAKARGLDRDVDGAAVAPVLARKLADEILPRLKDARAQGSFAAAYAELEKNRTLLPELDAVPALQKFLDGTADAREREIVALLRDGAIDEAADMFAELDGRLLRESAMAKLRGAMDDVSRAVELRERGDFEGAAASLRGAGTALGVAALGKLAGQLDKDGKKAEDVLRRARDLAATGQLIEARHELLPLLEQWPMHEGARREMEILDRGAHDKEQRLAQARDLAKEGRLREASALALSQAVPGPHGEEARILLKDVRARMDLVASGLDQVRRAVHGRDSGSVEGLRHCLLRLDQLTKVQTDNEELQAFQKAVDAEVEGLTLLVDLGEQIEEGKVVDVAARFEAVMKLRDSLLRPDRLDARLLETLDAVLARVDDGIATGRLEVAHSWLEALALAASTTPDLEEQARARRGEIDRLAAEAAAAVERGLAAVAARDLETAEECLTGAREVRVDGNDVQRLEQALRQVHGQEVVLAEVEELTARQDYDAAQRQLDRMPPTPAALRTRIFDIKSSLARAQGLDRGFLLRVDEGGEYLVLRGETVDIGNVREGKADLCILANIAGRHARFVRSMSFHGGMQDRIVADKGELMIGGKARPEHKLKSGDTIGLGRALSVTYRVPSKRSLTAGLTLSSGFQVEGTDKVLLMKDRGRDGRILIGPNPDAHVRTPHEQPEIELFASKDGQIRVRFEGEGQMNGRPFRGEHPVEAGALIRCGAVSFVLQPRPGRP